MILRKKIAYFFILLLSFYFINGQTVELDNLNFVDIEEGISKRPIYDIAEDQLGFIWIATHGSGLYRYDGISYKEYVYNWDDRFSINSNLVYFTFLDSKQRLWVGTNSGLNLYNRELDRFKNIDLSKITSKNIDIVCIVEDNEGNLLLGTYGYGLIKINMETLEVSKVKIAYASEAGTFINSLVKNKEGVIYAGTNQGLKVLDEKSNTLDKANFLTQSGIYNLENYIETLITDTNDNLLIGTRSNGVFKISKNQGFSIINNYAITKKKILSMLSIDDHIAVGTENDGLLILDQRGRIVHRYNTNKTDKKSISSNSVWSLYMDKENRIWIGFYNRGVAVHDKLFNKFNFLKKNSNNPESLGSSSILDIKEDKNGKLWIGIDGGVDLYDPRTKEIEHINGQNKSKYKGLTNESIEAVYIDSKNNIWLGSWNKGVFFLEEGTDTFINYNPESTNNELTSPGIVSFSEDSKGRIWMASYLKGVHYYDSALKKFFQCKSESFISLNIINADTKIVHVDSKDNVWLGTKNGLFKIVSDQQNNFRAISMREAVPAELRAHPGIHHILSIYEDKNHRIWIGTQGGGLLGYNEDKNTFTAYNNLDGFNETLVSAIIEDDEGLLWIGGKSGITNINIKANRTTNYTVDDGLLGNYFNNGAVYKDSKGTIYFGGYFGINYFNPKEIKLNNSEPSLYFSNLKLFNKDVFPSNENSPLEKVISETEKIVLNYDQSVFTIEYSSISFTRPEKNQYAYYLEGFDKEWNYVGNAKNATYTNLPVGNYIFKVKSANNDGIWNRTPIELKIKILPPWWKTTLAYLAYGLFAILAIFGISLFFRTRFEEKQIIQFERNKRIQEEKLNNKKLQFFTNISHEFRTPLTLIINPLMDIMDNSNLILEKGVKEKLGVIHKNVDRLSRLINELMDFRKLESNKILVQAEKVNIIERVKEVLEYFKEEAYHRNISLTFENSENNLESWIDSGMLEKILFNILSNAFKVTPDKGAIEVFVERTNDTYTISIEDTGPGINKKEYKKIFKRFYQVGKMNKSYYGSTGIGLEMVKNFTELNKGEIVVDSEINKGTVFSITFPLGKNHFKETEILNQKEDSFNKDNLVKENNLLVKEEDKLDLDFAKKEHTILIVEDNQELRAYLEQELKKYYNIILAKNGEEGLEIAQIKQPNIIITDVMMPILDGLELCKRIKNDIKTSHIPLLMLTARAMIEDKLEGINSGADAYLNKPFNIEILKSTLSQLLISRKILFDKYTNNLRANVTSKSEGINSLDKNFMQEVLEYVYENLSKTDLNVEILASNFSLSRSQFYRKVKTLSGLSANQFIRKVRLEKARELLEAKNLNVSEVMYKVGFSSSSYFAKCFKAEFGYSPIQIKNK